MRYYTGDTACSALNDRASRRWLRDSTPAGRLSPDRFSHAIHNLLAGRALDDSDLQEVERLVRSGGTEFLRAAAAGLTKAEPTTGTGDSRERRERPERVWP